MARANVYDLLGTWVRELLQEYRQQSLELLWSQLPDGIEAVQLHMNRGCRDGRWQPVQGDVEEVTGGPTLDERQQGYIFLFCSLYLDEHLNVEAALAGEPGTTPHLAVLRSDCGWQVRLTRPPRRTEEERRQALLRLLHRFQSGLAPWLSVHERVALCEGLSGEVSR